LWRKLYKILLKPPYRRSLIVEAVFFLGWARILKALPFQKVAPSLGSPMVESSYTSDASDETEIRNISKVIWMTSRHTWWQSMCLVKAIAAMKMLERRNIDSTLYLGTAKDSSGKLIAHAWLRSGPFYVTGAEEMSAFTEVGRFGKQINRKVKRGNAVHE